MAPIKSSLGKIAAAALLTFVLASGWLVIRWARTTSREPVPPKQSLPTPDLQNLRAQAENGDGKAANWLGEIYAEGKQVRQNYAEALRWYRQAAEAGVARAQYNLGVLHEIGQGVTADEAEAAKWYRKAAEQGYADAQYNLAALYGLGRGVPHDNAEAVKWYQRAAEQGDPLARYNLGQRYERGKGVSQDLVEAYKWHSLAAERGLKDAAAARDHLRRILTAPQRRQAEDRIRQFKSKYPEPSGLPGH